MDVNGVPRIEPDAISLPPTQSVEIAIAIEEAMKG